MEETTPAKKKTLPSLIDRLQKLDQKVNAMVIMGKALPMMIISSFLVLGGVSYLSSSRVITDSSLDTLPLTGSDAQVVFTTSGEGRTIPLNRNDSITIEITANESFSGGELQFTFNPDVVDMREPFIFTTLAIAENIVLEHDRVIVSFQTIQPSSTLRGEFIKLSFNAKAEGPIDLALDETQSTLYDSQNQPVSFDYAFSDYRVE